MKNPYTMNTGELVEAVLDTVARAERAEARVKELERALARAECSSPGEIPVDCTEGDPCATHELLGVAPTASVAVGATEDGECVQDCDADGVVCPRRKVSGSFIDALRAQGGHALADRVEKAQGPSEASTPVWDGLCPDEDECDRRARNNEPRLCPDSRTKEARPGCKTTSPNMGLGCMLLAGHEGACFWGGLPEHPRPEPAQVEVDWQALALELSAKLDAARTETALPPEVCAVIEAAERLAEEVWADNRTDEEQDAVCRAVQALRAVETGSGAT